MATEKQLAAVEKMRQAKAKKKLERENALKQAKAKPNDNKLDNELDDELDNQLDEELDNELDDKTNSYNESNDINLGFKIEQELLELWKQKITDIDSNLLKQKASSTYNMIFEAYEEGKKNGVETSNFLLLEYKPKIYILKKI